MDPISASYTPDITPLTLAAHYNSYEILKILLDRGATLPTPHDLKCSCDSCLTSSQEDSLRFSLSRINAYKALSSPSLIALTSSDPILTAFQLSDELKKLRDMETQFCSEYNELRKQVSIDISILLRFTLTNSLPVQFRSIKKQRLGCLVNKVTIFRISMPRNNYKTKELRN